MANKPAAPKEDKSRVVITPIGIACFAHVFQPFAFPAAKGEAPKEPQFGLILVLNKKKMETDKSWIALRKGVGAAIKLKFGEKKAQEMLNKKRLSLPFRDAEEYDQYGPPFQSGNWMINVKSRNAPGVVDERSQPIINQNDFYAGCLARVSCLPWAFDTAGNQGCTLLLNNVQKAGDGERLAGSVANAEDEFDALEEGDGDDDDLF